MPLPFCVAGLVMAISNAGSPYSFDRPEVLDLTEVQRLAPFKKGGDLVAEPLPPDVAAALLKMPDLNMDAPGQIAYTGEEGAAARKSEQPRIDAEKAVVHRAGQKLSITPRSGKRVTFRDWVAPVRPDADGDSETFVYAGRIGAARYHRIEVQFGHDAPGSFLVNPVSGKTVFVHNGGDVVALSPRAEWLVSLHTVSLPHLLVVAGLGATGPSVELLCHEDESHNVGRAMRADEIKSVSFKGWHDDHAFDLVLTLEGGSTIATRIGFDREAWRAAASDPKALTAAAYRCWQG